MGRTTSQSSSSFYFLLTSDLNAPVRVCGGVALLFGRLACLRSDVYKRLDGLMLC